MKPTILLVDDEEAIRFGFDKYLSRKGYMVHAVPSLAAAKTAFNAQEFDVVLLDLNLPDGNGIDWIAELRQSAPELAIVVITGTGEISVAVEAMRRGADNFLPKPVSMEDLDVYLRKSLELESLRRRDSTRRRLARSDEPYFGTSAPMLKVMDLARLAAENDSTALLQGETGTGKGVIARWIHDHSTRRSSPLVEVNCSGLRGDLLSSELFGHAKGAFTSAVQDRQGLVEAADGGTLFLDEIGDMDLAVQAQFLKVIEEKEYRRLGEVKIRRSEFRLLCATNHDLKKLTQDGRLREDLYFRINVFPIRMPSLREMPEDIPGLARHILGALGHKDQELSAEVVKTLQSYAWPGNIREVRNVLERATLLSRGGSIALEHLSGLAPQSAVAVVSSETLNLDQIEEANIHRALERFGGDVRKAADALGVSRATLYRRLKKTPPD